MNFATITRYMAFTALAFVSLSCGKKESNGGNRAPAPKAEKPTFAEVNAILTDKCATCHIDRPNELSFVGHEDVLNEPETAKSIADRITTTDAAKIMPKQRLTKPLTDDEKAKMLVFIGKAQPAPGAARLDFTTDINPILASKCTPCHADASRLQPHFIGHEDAFVAEVDDMEGVITGNGDKGIMPPPPLTATLSDAEKATILNYLGVN